MITLVKKTTSSPLGHSADVKLLLHVDSQSIPLGQTCDTGILLQRDEEIKAGPAKVEISVDGVSSISDVLITGKRAGDRWVDIVMVKGTAAQPAA